MPHHPATITIFPTWKRLSLVRDAALALRDLSSADGLVWWKQRAASMADELRTLGLPEHEVTRQIGEFQTAVFFDLGEISQCEQRSVD